MLAELLNNLQELRVTVISYVAVVFRSTFEQANPFPVIIGWVSLEGEETEGGRQGGREGRQGGREGRQGGGEGRQGGREGRHTEKTSWLF